MSISELMELIEKNNNEIKDIVLQEDADTQYALADLYANENNITHYNQRKAFFWYGKAAEQGHTIAQRCLGSYYVYGIGAAKDLAQAEYWLLKSANSGDVDSQALLGLIYCNKNDLVKAEYWLEKATNQGDAQSQELLTKIKKLLEVSII